jgi:hypothetical protein
MPSKRIIVFANSAKKRERCIAGMEIGRGESRTPTGWVRPVSGESEGELQLRHMLVHGGGFPSVLDIVDVPLTKHAEDAIHPEDWILEANRKWTRVGRLDPGELASLEEAPDDLWFQPHVGTDRATGEFLLKRPGHRSLYLIRPEQFRVAVSAIHYPDSPRPTIKRRAHFTYRGRAYEMNLTDPLFTEAHCNNPPAVGARPVTIRPRFTERCLLCVSLTPLYKDLHWKVVATVLELP